MNGEFDIIRRYFTASNRAPRKDVILTVGDDCAVTELNHNQQLATTTDTLVENIHFFPSVSPADLAYKAVAVNLSDLAAMGAEPAWVSLALTLPKADHQWLSEFSESFFRILDHYNVDLIGGDTTKGRLSLTITAQGLLQKNRLLCRHNAKVGDWIFVSGTLGDSAAGLQLLQEAQSAVGKSEIFSYNAAQEYLLQRHLRPTPRVLFGLELAMSELCNTAIDISDGFLADLTHILTRSRCAAVIDIDKLPLSAELIATAGMENAVRLALSGGEDYELCFTVSEANRAKLDRTLANLNVPYACVGQIRHAKRPGTIFFQRFGQPVEAPNYPQGFDHFA